MINSANASPYPRWLLGIFTIYWLIWAYKPLLLSDWILENVLQVSGLAVLILTYQRYPLSNFSYTLILVFCCLHTIGAHYSYSGVPYSEWSQVLAGFGIDERFGFNRNHYDRFMHFLFGLLLTLPLYEYYLRFVSSHWSLNYCLPLNLTMSISLFYELVEWAAAEVFGGELGQAFLGIQGDQWDAQKDMALATVGGAICMLITAWHTRYKDNAIARP
ncbi:MAG: DUF2238 domain-containing protein [Acidobacteria bacterium]|nr:DUF2238 domain-containing protein [Acidobacteriota bacterium]